MLAIKKYDYGRDYEHILESLMLEKWQSFYEERKDEYLLALNNSYSYVLYDNKQYCGFIRGISDGVFTLFIAELIINEEYRRKGYGRKLIEYVHGLVPLTRIDLISDNDEFYATLGFHFVGKGMRKHNWY